MKYGQFRQITNIIVVIAAILLCAVGCGSTGSNSALRLSNIDRQQPGALLPIAASTQVHYRVEDANSVRGSLSVTSATSTDPEVLTAEIQEDGTLQVSALAAGTATLNVTTDNDKSDAFALEVRKVNNVVMTMSTMKNSSRHRWANVSLDMRLNIPSGAAIDAAFRNFTDTDGHRLAGTPDSLEYTLEGPTGSFQAIELKDGLNWAFTGGDDGDGVTITSAYGTWSLRTKDALEPDSMEIYDSAAFRTGALERTDHTIFAPQGSTSFIDFIPVDADGYQYIGDYDYHATMTLQNADGFAPILDGGLTSHDDVNTCTKPIDTAADTCAAWTNLERLSIQLHAPDDAASMIIAIEIGAWTTSYTVKAGSPRASAE